MFLIKNFDAILFVCIYISVFPSISSTFFFLVHFPYKKPLFQLVRGDGFLGVCVVIQVCVVVFYVFLMYLCLLLKFLYFFFFFY